MFDLICLFDKFWFWYHLRVDLYFNRTMNLVSPLSSLFKIQIATIASLSLEISRIPDK